MNRSRSFFTLISLAAFANWFFASPLQAATFGDFTYRVVGSSVTITNYPEDASGPVTIPSEIEGKPVTAIGSNAFAHCTKMTAVSIPNSIKTIGKRAFGTCGLSSVTIPESVTHIRAGAFRKCSLLKSVTIGSGVTSIGGGAFEFCRSLADITVDESNPKFSSQDGVLYDKLRTRMVEVPTGFVGTFTSPKNLISIKPEAFRQRVHLTRVKIGDGVTLIGFKAFSDCYRLTDVTIGSGVTSIGARAFNSCIALEAVTVDGSNPKFSSQDGVLFNKAKTKIVHFPRHFAGDYTIPDSVTSMPDDSFTYCAWLTRLTIGSGITSIPQMAFTDCHSLTSITVGTGVTTIRGDKSYYEPFNHCPVFDKVIFLGNAPQLEAGVFKSSYFPANFTVYFSPGSSGFTVPEWHGKPSVAGVPEMEIKTPDAVLIDGDSISSFGEVAVNSPVVQTFTIKNTGTAPLKDLSIEKDGANSGDFTVTSPLETTLAPGTSTTFDVTFEPSSPSTRTAAIHIRSYDSLHNPFDIQLEGDGIPATAVASAIASAPAFPSGSAFAISADWNLPTSGDLTISGHGGGNKTRVVVSGGRKYLTLTVFKTPGTRYQKRVVEVSPDLLNWYSGSNYTTTQRDDAALLEVRDNTPLTPGSKRYMRLK
ncbi:MAG: leucine-rich repeat protein [Verrucomicrobiota bacterium]